MNGVGSVEPKAQIMFYDFLQDGAQVPLKIYEKGVVIKGEIPYPALPVPVQDFIENLMGILWDEPRVQETARAVFTTVRAPGGGHDRDIVHSVEEVEGGKGKRF